jgi:hypothetical protein
MSVATIRIYDDGGSRLHVQWFCRDSGLWREILDSFKSWFPAHHDRAYSPDSKTWSVPRWHAERLATWIEEWFEPGEQEWLDEEPAGEHGHNYSRSGYSQYRRPQTSTSTMEAAFATLHLLPSAPTWVTEAVYWAAIKVHHPDAGGDGQTMVRIHRAMERIREHQEHERKAS